MNWHISTPASASGSKNASRVAGSLPHALARADAGPITIAHPSGTTVVDAAVEAILDRAHTGKPGDGRIFMVDLVECIHIRTRRQHRSNAA